MEEQKDKKDKKVRKDKRLSSKINSRFIALTLIAILCTMILSTTVYYDLFKRRSCAIWKLHTDLEECRII